MVDTPEVKPPVTSQASESFNKDPVPVVETKPEALPKGTSVRLLDGADLGKTGVLQSTNPDGTANVLLDGSAVVATGNVEPGPTKEEKLWTLIDAVRALHPSGGDWPGVLADTFEALAPSPRPVKPKLLEAVPPVFDKENPIFVEGYNAGLADGKNNHMKEPMAKPPEVLKNEKPEPSLSWTPQPNPPNPMPLAQVPPNG